MDIVSDALIRIKNGYMAKKDSVVLPYSKHVLSICKVLQNEGYIDQVEEVLSGKHNNLKNISAKLLYVAKKPALTEVKKISKPGLRVYKNKKAIPYVLDGYGLALISTPKGVMTDKQARKEGLGGEVIAFVW